jgi:hypothetical protein
VTFSQYVLTCYFVPGTSSADFVQDAQRLILNGTLPPVESWGALDAFMAETGACQHLIDAARRTWIDYERAGRGKRLH